jgi:hypothetical protein
MRSARAITAAAAGAVLATIAIGACGGTSAPAAQTPVQRCTTAYQAYVNAGLNGQSAASIRAYGSANDVKILNAAHKACDPLTPAQAKKAAAGLTG